MRTDATIRGGGGQPDAPAVGHPTPPPADTPSFASGQPSIPGYTLLRVLGRGGMGAVYEAEQHDPRRRVAVKVIATPTPDAEATARFAVERQAVARLDHPHVARVFDAGTTPGGMAFFAMELVPGQPLTAYCRARQSGLRDRLTLFAQVCRAVQHAHQKGVIHRDLKPSNILVVEVDGRPAPKVIDFGLAKLCGDDDPTVTRTRAGVLAGTPLYMAPEQANPFARSHADTRCDVYSLGVVLYELLTGRTPLLASELDGLDSHQFLEKVRDHRPPPPSAASGAGVTATLRGELDWVALKCLEKDPERRYQTADQLADDLDRYLADQPVTACPPSRWYAARKFVKRNRIPVSVAAAMLGLLLLGGAGTTAGMVSALEHERRAADAERVAREHEGRAVEGERVARERSDQLQRTNRLLADVFRDMNPRLAGRDAPPLAAALGERLALAAAHLDDSLGDPLAVADLRQVLGQTLLTLGYPAEAQPLLERSADAFRDHLGATAPRTFEARSRVAVALHARGETAAAAAVHEELLALHRRLSGDAHPDTAACLNNLALCHTSAGKDAAALPLYEEAAKVLTAASGPDHPDTLGTVGNLARVYSRLSRFDRAKELAEGVLARRTAARGADHPDTLGAASSLAVILYEAGDLKRSLKLHQDCRARRLGTLGENHPDTLVSTDSLAALLRLTGDPAKALPMHEQVLAARTARFGPDHPEVLATRFLVAECHRMLGRADEAQSMLAALADRQAEKLGPDHSSTLATRNALAMTYGELGRHAEMLTILEDVHRRQAATLGPDHQQTLATRVNLGFAYRGLRRFDDAARELEAVAARSATVLGRNHPDTLTTDAALAESYRTGGRLPEALKLAEATYRTRATVLGDNHPDTLISLNNLALCQHMSGRYDEAIAAFELIHERHAAARGAEDPATLTALNTLAAAFLLADRVEPAVRRFEEYLTAVRRRPRLPDPRLASDLAKIGVRLLGVKKPGLAEQYLRESLAVRKLQPVTDWMSPNVESILGESLLDQKKYTEARPHLEAGYRDLRAMAEKIPSAVRRQCVEEALDRLVRLATDARRPDDVSRWQAERTTLPVEELPRPRSAGR